MDNTFSEWLQELKDQRTINLEDAVETLKKVPGVGNRALNALRNLPPADKDPAALYVIADHYGYDSQSRQLVEEMGELTAALNHFWRQDLQCGSVAFAPDLHTDHILEEAADVEICLRQLIYMLHGEDRIMELIDNKLRRQQERISHERSVSM